MNQTLTSLGLAALLSCFSAFGETPRSDAKLAALRTPNIERGTITTVERDGSATKTIVKLVLNPATGSNINVEVWLPEADKWNARFLGLGNGGAEHEVIGNGAKTTQVEDADVFRFFVIGVRGAGAGEFEVFHVFSGREASDRRSAMVLTELLHSHHAALTQPLGCVAVWRP